jgi:hypothetical protein
MDRATRSKRKNGTLVVVAVYSELLDAIEETISVLDGATHRATLLTKSNVMDIALPVELFKEYRAAGGPVAKRLDFKRPITQAIAIRDAIWKANDSGDMEEAQHMVDKFTTHLSGLEAFMKTGVIQD